MYIMDLYSIFIAVKIQYLWKSNIFSMYQNFQNLQYIKFQIYFIHIYEMSRLVIDLIKIVILVDNR